MLRFLQHSIFLLLVGFMSIPSYGQATWRYQEAADSVNWNYNGWPADQPGAIGDSVVLCGDAKKSYGSMFFKEQIQLNLCTKWRVSFRFRMYQGSHLVGGNNADGIVFAFLENPPTGFVSGGGIGIPADSRGLFVGLDTYPNTRRRKPELQIFEAYQTLNDFNGGAEWEDLVKRGDYKRANQLRDAGQWTSSNKKWRYCEIEFDEGHLMVRVKKNFGDAWNVLEKDLEYSYDYTGYLGFTSATGGASDHHEIKDINVEILKDNNDESVTSFICESSGNTELFVDEGYDSYKWYKEVGGTVQEIPGTQDSRTYEVSETGKYHVDFAHSCGISRKTFDVEYVANAKHPLKDVSDALPNVELQRNEQYGREDGYIYLCEDPIIINPGIANANYTWTANTDSGNYYTSSASIFTVNEPGQYEVQVDMLTSTGNSIGCTRTYYFTATQNILNPQLLVKQEDCIDPNEIQVENIGDQSDFEFILERQDASGAGFSFVAAQVGDGHFQDLPEGYYRIRFNPTAIGTLSDFISCEYLTETVFLEDFYYNFSTTPPIIEDVTCWDDMNGAVTYYLDKSPRALDVKHELYLLADPAKGRMTEILFASQISHESEIRFTDLPKGDYEIRMSVDACVPPGPMNFTIGGSDEPLLELLTNGLTCNGGTDASAELNVISGGIAPFEYSIDGVNWESETNKLFTGLSAGNYLLQARDANGCVAELDFEIQDPSPLVLTLTTVVDPSCFAASDGNMQLTVSGGIAPYGFSIDGGLSWHSTPVFNNLPAPTGGSYDVMVADRYTGVGFDPSAAGSCTTMLAVPMSEPQLLDFTIRAEKIVCDESGEIEITATGGTAPYMYSIDKGVTWQNSHIYYPEVGANYSVLVRDAKGCTTPERLVPIINESEVDSFDFSVLMPGSGAAAATTDLTCSSPARDIRLDQVRVKQEVAGVSTVVPLPDLNDVSFQVYKAPLLPGALPYKSIDRTEVNKLLTDLEVGEYVLEVVYHNASTEECKTTIPFVLSGNMDVDFVQTSTDVQCFGADNGSIELNFTAGTAPFTAKIVNRATGAASAPDHIDATGARFEGLPPGSYDINVSEAGGCNITSLEPARIKEPMEALSLAFMTEASSSCQPTGIISVSASGGWGTYQYKIFPQGGDPSVVSYISDTEFRALAGGNYTVMATDSTGCEISQDIVLPQHAPVAVNELSSSNELCNGFGGTIHVVTSGGNPTGMHYYRLEGSNDWIAASDSSGFYTHTFRNLIPGNYNVWVKDADDCEIKLTPSIDLYPTEVLSAALAVDPITCAGANNGGGTIHATGPKDPVGKYTFKLYQKNELGGPDAVVNTALADNNFAFQNLGPGSYYVGISNTYCDEEFSNVITLVDPDPIGMDVSYTQGTSSCQPVEGVIEFTAYGGQGAFTYCIIDDGSGAVLNTNTTGQFTGLSAGEYRLHVEDAFGCVFAPDTLIQLQQRITPTFQNVVVDQIACFEDLGGSISFNIQGPPGEYAYALKGGEFTDITIEQGETASTTILLENVVEDADGQLLVIDKESNCRVIQEYNMMRPEKIQASASISSDIVCFESATGQILVDQFSGGTGQLEFSLIDFSTGQRVASQQQVLFENLSSGYYYLEVSDENGCTATFYEDAPLQLTEPLNGELILDAPQVDLILCNDVFDGVQIAALASGGEGILQYRLEELNSGKLVTDWGMVRNWDYITHNIAEGKYRVSVRDERACTVYSSEIDIVNPTPVQANAQLLSGLNCYGDADGVLEVAISGGVPPYQVSLNGVDYFTTMDSYTFQNVEGNDAGLIPLFIRDANSCSPIAPVTASFEVVKELVVDTSQEPLAPSCHNGEDGAFTLFAQQEGAEVNYYLNDLGNTPQSTGVFSNLSPGNYTVYVEGVGANGSSCIQPVNFNIPNPSQISGSYEIDYNCYEGMQFIVQAEGGSGNYTYDFGNGPQSENSIAISSNSVVQFSIMDDRCSTPFTFRLEIPLLEPLEISGDVTSFGQIKLEASGGMEPYEFAMENGEWVGSPYFEVNKPGTYNFSMRDANGCVQTVPVEMEMKGILIPNFFTPNADGYNDRWEIRVQDERLNDEASIQLFKEFYPDAKISVFDRYGRLMAQYSGADQGWNGNFAGGSAHADSYWYKVELSEDAAAVYTGHVSIKR